MSRTSQCDDRYLDRAGNCGNQAGVVSLSFAISVDTLKNYFTRPGLLDRFGLSDRISVRHGTPTIEKYAPIVVYMATIDARCNSLGSEAIS